MANNIRFLLYAYPAFVTISNGLSLPGIDKTSYFYGDKLSPGMVKKNVDPFPNSDSALMGVFSGLGTSVTKEMGVRSATELTI